jgi:hypothetical protein
MDTWNHGEIILTWCRKGQHYLGYWINLDDSQVLLGHQVGYMEARVKPQRYSSMMDVNQWYTWLGVNDVQALFRKVKQEFETNKKMLMFIKSERSSGLRARIWLVAIRLQTQHSFFGYVPQVIRHPFGRSWKWDLFTNFQRGNAIFIL